VKAKLIQTIYLLSSHLVGSNTLPCACVLDNWRSKTIIGFTIFRDFVERWKIFGRNVFCRLF